MSGLESIKNKILQDAKARADEIIKDAQAKASDILKNAENEIAMNKKSADEKAWQDAQKAQERVLSATNMEIKKAELVAKRQLINECFDDAYNKILNMPLPDYEDFLVKLMVSSAKGKSEVCFAEEDCKRIDTKRVVEAANKLLTQNGSGAALILSSEIMSGSCGFCLKIGDVFINNIIQTLIDSKREQLEIKLAAILFK